VLRRHGWDDVARQLAGCYRAALAR
jgi:hypothetical protein